MHSDTKIDPAIVETSPDRLIEGSSRGIREALRLWQEQHKIALAETSGRTLSSTLSDTQNLFTQSGEDESFIAIARDEELEDDDDDVDFGPDEPSPNIFARQVYLRRGDLVELT